VIRSRSYAVPLVAVLLALATGVALGAGPLTDTRSSAATGSSASSTTASRTADAYPDEFAGAVSAALYQHGLSRRPVALVTMPGADPATVAALTSQVREAGGQLVATYPVGYQLVDPEQKSLVDTLGAQLRTQLHGQVSATASTYVRAGQLLAVAAANTGSAAGQLTGDVSAVRQSLVAARLLTVPTGSPTTAPLVLVVLGRNLDQAIVDGLVSGLASRSRGVVVAGATRNPDLVGLRTDGVSKQATTVDGSETSAGRVAAVLGLIRAWSTRGGAFGASGADGPVPLG
jgi:hypothetical protein